MKEELRIQEGLNEENQERALTTIGQTAVDKRRPNTVIENIRRVPAIKKQGFGIAVFGSLVAVLGAVYFLVLHPVLTREPDPEMMEMVILEGETINHADRFTITPLDDADNNRVRIEATGGVRLENLRIMIRPRVERSQIRYVDVRNHVDEYRVVHHLGQNFFYVERAEFARVDPELLAQFVVNTGYLLSMLRVAARDVDDGNEILADLEQFGFHEGSAQFTVTKVDGSWYTIIIGDRIPTQGGYYVMYKDENGLREAIYILDTMMSDTVLSYRYSLLTPLVTRPVGNINDMMFIDHFRFYRGRDLMVHIYNAEIPEDSNMLLNRQMLYPAPYSVSDNFSHLLAELLGGLRGERVVHAFGIDDLVNADDENFDDKMGEAFERFGFVPYSAKITFLHHDEEYFILFSQPNEDGNYYVFDIHYQTIVEINPEDAAFIEWELRRFIGRDIFMRNINDVAQIEVRSPGQHAQFTLEHGEELIVRGGEYGGDLEVIETQNFRWFYRSILSIELWEEQEDPRVDGTEALAELIITMLNGTVYEYAFYFVPGNTRRSFFTFNGAGEFYIMRDRVLKLIDDTARVLRGDTIDPDGLEPTRD